MHPILYYVIFSYPIITGILWEADNRDSHLLEKAFVWVFSPIFLPIYIGMFLSKIFNK